MSARFVLCLVLVISYHAGWALYFTNTQAERVNASAKQINDPKAQEENVMGQMLREFAYVGGWCVLAIAATVIMLPDVKSIMKKAMTATTALLILCNTGCLRPIEPVVNKEINSHEEAFLIPYQGDAAQQQAANNEEFLKKNLVFAKQVRIPQQWIATGREWLGPNGKWHDAATLIVVDIAPVTREWTADKHSGTGTKDEAIWVMTADSIEFSTGWTVTAKIDDRDAAVKFLHNYRNGSLATIMDTEIRAKVQADFGLEVTDLPMETLRKSATPHLTKVIKAVKETFSVKGINITNIGITGGFVYKNPTISEKMVAVFNAEQEKDIAISKTKAQEEANKAVILKSQGEADAILKTKKAEADGIKMLADAKFYEIEKSKENLAAYVQLKTLELQKTQLEKWDGRFPVYYMGNVPPNAMLTMPSPK